MQNHQKDRYAAGPSMSKLVSGGGNEHRTGQHPPAIPIWRDRCQDPVCGFQHSVLDIFHQKLTQLAVIVGLEHSIESETNKEAI